MRGLILLMVVACGAPRPTTDPLAKLRSYEAAMCWCPEHPDPKAVELGAVDEDCSIAASEPVKAWVGDGTSWQVGLTPDEVTEAKAILERIRRCFQAGIGDPLPPKRATGS
jgi:hypothetical protein